MTSLMADQPTSGGDSGRRSRVKAGLTPNRRRQTFENDEYEEFARRILRAYTRRVADGDVEALSLMTGPPTTPSPRRSRACALGVTPGPRSAPGSASPARPHSSDGEHRTCPRDVPGPPSTPNLRHGEQRKKLKLARTLSPRATHQNTLVMHSSPTTNGSHAGSHTDEQPSEASDPSGQPEETRPRSRTDPYGTGRRYGNLRIRRLGVRVPPSALIFPQARALFFKVGREFGSWCGVWRLTISYSPMRSCGSWRALPGPVAGLPRSHGRRSSA